MGSIQLVDRHGRNILSILAQPRRTALLAFLAVATEDGMEDRTRLASMFWPHLDADEGAARLDRAMHALQRSLTRGSVCNDGNGRVGICRNRIATDLDDLREALARGDAPEVAKLYRGPLMQTLDLPRLPAFQAWLDEERSCIQEAVRVVDRPPTLVVVESDSRVQCTAPGPPVSDGTESQASGRSDPSHRRRRFLDLVLRVG